jgi:hypothetical protein
MAASAYPRTDRANVDVLGSVGGVRARHIYNSAFNTNEGAGWLASYSEILLHRSLGY